MIKTPNTIKENDLWKIKMFMREMDLKEFRLKINNFIGIDEKKSFPVKGRIIKFGQFYLVSNGKEIWLEYSHHKPKRLPDHLVYNEHIKDKEDFSEWYAWIPEIINGFFSKYAKEIIQQHKKEIKKGQRKNRILS